MGAELLIPEKRFYANLSHCVLMEKLHVRDSSVNNFILKKFYRTDTQKKKGTAVPSLIFVFLETFLAFPLGLSGKSLSGTLLNMSQMAGDLQVTHLPRSHTCNPAC